ncbi:MAG: hypothetical protein EZS28_050137, partial [Streblomastix strix]
MTLSAGIRYHSQPKSMRRIAEVFVGEMKDGTTSEGISDGTGRSSSAQVLQKKNPRSHSSNTLTGQE